MTTKHRVPYRGGRGAGGPEKPQRVSVGGDELRRVFGGRKRERGNQGAETLTQKGRCATRRARICDYPPPHPFLSALIHPDLALPLLLLAGFIILHICASHCTLTPHAVYARVGTLAILSRARAWFIHTSWAIPEPCLSAAPP